MKVPVYNLDTMSKLEWLYVGTNHCVGIYSVLSITLCEWVLGWEKVLFNVVLVSINSW